MKDVCRVSKDQEDKAIMQSRKLKKSKSSFKFEKINDLDVKNPKNIPNAKRVLTVVQSGVAGQ